MFYNAPYLVYTFFVFKHQTTRVESKHSCSKLPSINIGYNYNLILGQSELALLMNIHEVKNRIKRRVVNPYFNIIL